MMKKSSEKFVVRPYAFRIFLLFIIIGTGTVIDFIVHSSSYELYVPPVYYLNKVIYGVFWGFVASIVVSRFSFFDGVIVKSVGICFIVATVLQTKYFLQGYDLFFVFLFLFLHFLMFLAPAIFIIRKYESFFK